jgi:acyl carrier protein
MRSCRRRSSFDGPRPDCKPLGRDRERVVGQAKFAKDLGIDWLDLLDLIIVIEEQFGIEIDDVAVDRITTVDHLIEVIEERQKGCPPISRDETRQCGPHPSRTRIRGRADRA